MFIEFVTQPQFDFLTAFADALKVAVVNNELQIPSSLPWAKGLYAGLILMMISAC